MADSVDPIRPKPSTPAPLKRIWKSPPEDDLPDPPRAKPSSSRSDIEPEEPRIRKKKKEEVVIDDGTGATKLEETPVLDTYEARQRARWLIGGLLTAIFALGLIIVLRAFRASGGEEIREGEPPDLRIVNDTRSSSEFEARNILDNAKQADKVGKTKAAIDLLNKLTRTYQSSAAAREAMHAIDRNRRNLPLFGVDVPEQLSGPKPPNSSTPTATAPSRPPTGGTNLSAPKVAKSPENPVAPSVSATPPAPPIEIKALPSGYRPNFDAPIHPSGWPTRITCDRDGADLMLVPASTFLMGREDGEPAERPVHRVSVSTYYIDRHEVTVRQYLLFLKETGRPVDILKHAQKETTDPPPTGDHPMVNVSAREAKAFCLWAGRRLPTEAQWELAARSPEGKISYWNGELPRKDPARGPRPMEPVMSLPSDLSPCGAYDMGANAWEWTSEYYDSQSYQQFRNLVVDPTGPKESRAKIAQVTVKGGSKSGILTWRDGQKMENRLPYLGFRGALPVEGLPAAPPEATMPAPNTSPILPGGVQPF